MATITSWEIVPVLAARSEGAAAPERALLVLRASALGRELFLHFDGVTLEQLTDDELRTAVERALLDADRAADGDAVA